MTILLSPNQLLQLYFDRFVNRTDIWFKQWTHQSHYGYRCMKQGDKGYTPVTLELINDHFEGNVTMSHPATDENGFCKWACWDSDADSCHLDTIETLLKDWGFFPLREAKRPARDGHSWLFFDQPVHATNLIRFNIELLGQSKLTGNDVEFFPKSALKHSQVRGPFGIHLKPEAKRERSWFEGAPHTIPDQLQWLSEQPLNSTNSIVRIADELHRLDAARKQSNLLNFAPRSYRHTQVSILDMVTNKRRLGNDWAAQCPICALEGHDHRQDNLRISLDGSKFCCVFGGPGVVHKGRDIVDLLTPGLSCKSAG